MKIALAIKHFDSARGGGEAYAVGLAQALATEGHEVHIFSWPAPPIFFNGVTLHAIPRNSATTFHYLESFAENCGRAVSEQHFDVVFGLTQVFQQDLHRMGGGVYRHWVNVLKGEGVWKITTARFNQAHRWHVMAEERILSDPGLKFIIVNSELCRTQLEEYYQIQPERVRLIRNPIDFSRFNTTMRRRYGHQAKEQLLLDRNRKTICFCANNFKRKGLDLLFKAIASRERLQQMYQILVLGRGEKRAFRSLAKRLGITRDVRFTGYTSRPEDFYAASDLFVLPTVYDPCANVCLEALACGIPVVTTADNGASELIRDGVNGFVLRERRSVKALADILEQAYYQGGGFADPETVARSVASLTWQNHVDQILGIFDRTPHANPVVHCA